MCVFAHGTQPKRYHVGWIQPLLIQPWHLTISAAWQEGRPLSVPYLPKYTHRLHVEMVQGGLDSISTWLVLLPLTLLRCHSQGRGVEAGFETRNSDPCLICGLCERWQVETGVLLHLETEILTALLTRPQCPKKCISIAQKHCEPGLFESPILQMRKPSVKEANDLLQVTESQRWSWDLNASRSDSKAPVLSTIAFCHSWSILLRGIELYVLRNMELQRLIRFSAYQEIGIPTAGKNSYSPEKGQRYVYMARSPLLYTWD